MKKIRITNLNIQKYIEENGIRPIYEDYEREAAVYKLTPKLVSLLESYSIKSLAIPNRR